MDNKTEDDSKTLTEQCEDQMLKVVHMRNKYRKICIAYASRAIDYDNKVAERKVELLKKYKFSKAPINNISCDSSLDNLFLKIKTLDDEYSQESLRMRNKWEAVSEVIAQIDNNTKHEKFGKLF